MMPIIDMDMIPVIVAYNWKVHLGSRRVIPAQMQVRNSVDTNITASTNQSRTTTAKAAGGNVFE